MIFSIHIPKTAGTSFRRALEERYGERLAMYYGVKDPKTTEGLRVRPAELPEAAARLADRGFEVLHGHYHFSAVSHLVTDPKTQVWTWLRDPVERTLSQFSFYNERPLELMALAEKVKAGEIDLETFARHRTCRDLQTRYLDGLKLHEIGFVGITEQFEIGLALLFGDAAPQLKRRYNATEKKTSVTEAQRTKLAAVNARDMQLYAEGLRLFVNRLADAAGVAAPERPTAAGAGLLKRLIRKVA